MFGLLLKNKHLKDFLNQSAIHGLRLLLYYTRFKYARFLWTVFIFAVIIWTHFIIISLTFQYIQQPTEVHMSTNLVHVSNTPFPGVAVCSANKLSRTKVLKFAEKVNTDIENLFQVLDIGGQGGSVTVRIQQVLRIGMEVDVQRNFTLQRLEVVSQRAGFDFGEGRRTSIGVGAGIVARANHIPLEAPVTVGISTKTAAIGSTSLTPHAIGGVGVNITIGIGMRENVPVVVLSYLANAGHKSGTLWGATTTLMGLLMECMPFKNIIESEAPSKFFKTSNSASLEAVVFFEQQQAYKPYYLAQTTQEMAQYLLHFKGFYIFPHDNQPLNFTLLYRLDKIFNFMFNTTKYPIRDYLKILAPDCKNLIIRGTIYGQEINTRDYFNKRLTSSSVCCMFNYNRRGYSIDPKTRKADNRFAENAEKIKFESNSILNSIQFVLRSDSEDFTITEFHNTAFQLFIFPREDYATIQSNRIGEILVDYNTIVEVPIEPEFFGSTQRVRQFSPDVRNCYFPDEGQKLLNQSYYSIDECLLLCRMQSMLKYCGCVTPPMAATSKNINYCSFINLPCLMKWKAIWYGWDQFEYVHENGKDLKDDFTTGHRCPQCLPNCNGVDYNLEVNEMTMRPTYGQFYSHGILEGLNNAKPLAIVKLYFKQRYVLATEMDIVGDWVVLLNRFGGIMSLMYGFSIISYIEIIYFATGKFFAYHLDSWKLKLERKLSTLTSATEKVLDVNGENDEPPPAYNLCWRELKPKQPVDMEIFKHDVILHLYKRDE
ncbi:pickpocket protein 28 [Calliphora vicina]|uniref:pickpocket protein 28 n=1 Tax=Calliphora vicina TaxID=7373 RepID=UPI00325B2F1C